MEAFLMEKATVKSIISPVDLDAGANTGNRVDMSKCRRVTFVLDVKAGTTPSSHTLTIEQHTVASAGTPLALAVDNPYYHKLNAATEFTKVVPTVATDSYNIDTLVGDAKFMIVFEVLAEQLAEGYRWVSVNLTDAGGAQLGACLAICHEVHNAPAYGTAV